MISVCPDSLPIAFKRLLVSALMLATVLFLTPSASFAFMHKGWDDHLNNTYNSYMKPTPTPKIQGAKDRGKSKSGPLSGFFKRISKKLESRSHTNNILPKPKPTFSPSPRPLSKPPLSSKVEAAKDSRQVEGVQVPREYTVSAGDSLSKIAEKFYDKQEFWPALAQANNIVNANLIYVGSRLQIPQKGKVEETKAQLSATSYQVKEGDTLFIIAQEVYGDGARWPVLSRANKVGRLSNGNPLIFAGSTLVIPR